MTEIYCEKKVNFNSFDKKVNPSQSSVRHSSLRSGNGLLYSDPLYY